MQRLRVNVPAVVHQTIEDRGASPATSSTPGISARCAHSRAARSAARSSGSGAREPEPP